MVSFDLLDLVAVNWRRERNLNSMTCSDILGFLWELQASFSHRTTICFWPCWVSAAAGALPWSEGAETALGYGAWLLSAVGPPLQSLGLGHASSAAAAPEHLQTDCIKVLMAWISSLSLWVTLHVFLWMLCLSMCSSITVDRCEVCWTIFANKWTVILYLVIKTGLSSVRETGRYSNLDLNWPSPPILPKYWEFSWWKPPKEFQIIRVLQQMDGSGVISPWVTGLHGWGATVLLLLLRAWWRLVPGPFRICALTSWPENCCWWDKSN